MALYWRELVECENLTYLISVNHFTTNSEQKHSYVLDSQTWEEHFQVRDKSLNFDHTEKVEGKPGKVIQNTGKWKKKYWKSQGNLPVRKVETMTNIVKKV